MQTLEKAPTRAQRSRQILAVLAKHGFAAAGTGLTLPAGFEREHNHAQHARQACEELGTTFIKLGQILSTRADLLPPDFRSELTKLQDDVPPTETAPIEDLIEDELGGRPGALFATFDLVPIASASIGQVYSAQLADGTPLVVKVRKPNIAELVERDLEIVGRLVASSKRYFPQLEPYDLEGMLDDFADTLRAELDYLREGRTIEAFREIFDGESGFALPEVLWEYTTSRVLTMTSVDGAKISESPQLGPKRREAAARRIARFMLEPALIHGIFHADPHPGNLLVQSSGAIGAIDFGMVVRLPDATRREVVDLFLALQRRDPPRIVDRLLTLAPPHRPVDRTQLGSRVARLLERYMGESLERIEIGAALTEMLEIVRTNGLRPPGSLAMLFKAIAVSEGIVVAIAPDKTLADFLEPIARSVSAARLAPQDWARRASESAMEVAELSVELPRRADRVLADIERGNLRVWARVEEFEPALQRLERMVERANSTIIAAACIVGLTVLLVVYHPQAWQATVAWIFWTAFVIATLVVFRTAWATLRRRG